MTALLGSCLLVLALISATGASADLFDVDEASDICPETADPCVISSVVKVVDMAQLDFGTRAVQILGSGLIDAGAGSVRIRCGHLRVATGTAVGIRLSGAGNFGTVGGYGEVLARRRCSGDTSIFCLAESDCALLAAGTCSVGSGTIEIAGRIFGNAADPAVISLRAAGDVIVTQQIQANTTVDDGDGGSIDIQAAGAVNVAGRLQATGRLTGSGGSLSLSAGGDVIVSAPIDLTGGDLDGGLLDVTAGRDFIVSEDIDASSVAGGGFGGEISVSAERDISVVGGTNLNRLLLDTDGHESAIDLYGGDGGTQDYMAGRDIRLGPLVVANSRGAPPDGYGEEISFDAGRDVLIEGKLDVKAKGTFGGGGYVTIFAGRTVYVTETSTFDLTGGDGGGETTIDAFETVTFAGSADATTGTTKSPGRVDVSSTIGNVAVSGSFIVRGAKVAAGTSLVNLAGCSVQLFSGATILNAPASASTSLTARERINVEAGASVSTSAGTNRFIYRDPARPPLISGIVTPAATLIVAENLVACPVCGNGTREAGETCDDANRNNGDGCSAACQDEGCVFGTPGFPETSLCDDGRPCTTDLCDTEAHVCVNTDSCAAEDGPCTVDRCGENGFCLHLPDDSRCVDALACTRDVCGSGGRCQHLADSSQCDDGIGCTLDLCEVRLGLGCTHAAKDTRCNDSNVCTSDRCDVIADCLHIALQQPCNDGLACTIEDACVEGVCQGNSICEPEQICRPRTGECGPSTTTTTTVTTTSTTVTPTTTTTVTTTSTTVTPTTTTTVVTPTTSTTSAPTTTTLPGRCGDGEVEEGEQCDSGDLPWSPGQSCRDCELLACGDPNGSGDQNASDALFALRAAVDAVPCDCVCNADGLGSVTASDALRILRKAVGIDVTLACPCS